MKFFQRMDLKNHLRIHTNEKAFKCSRCTSDFRDLKSLKRHSFLSHKTKKIYICECEEDFEFYKDFLSHRRTHHQEREVKNDDEIHEIIYIPVKE